MTKFNFTLSQARQIEARIERKIDNNEVVSTKDYQKYEAAQAIIYNYSDVIAGKVVQESRQSVTA
jgi:hypothetical protein